MNNQSKKSKKNRKLLKCFKQAPISNLLLIDEKSIKDFELIEEDFPRFDVFIELNEEAKNYGKPIFL